MELMSDRRSVPTPCPPNAMPPRSSSLVLLSCGSAAQIALLQQQSGNALASCLGLALAPPLPAEPGCTPAAMAAALENLASGSLKPLPLDPGLLLDGGHHWAETLGAWRQPCLMLLAAEQLNSGQPAASVALLAQWQVPLVGLVQADGSWQEQARRSEPLPWLGGLGGDLDALAAATTLRWQQLNAALA